MVPNVRTCAGWILSLDYKPEKLRVYMKMAFRWALMGRERRVLRLRCFAFIGQQNYENELLRVLAVQLLLLFNCLVSFIYMLASVYHLGGGSRRFKDSRLCVAVCEHATIAIEQEIE